MNTTGTYSNLTIGGEMYRTLPVTHMAFGSSDGWSRLASLVLLASLAVIGSVGNIFMISAVMIEDHLKKRGNAFLANVALADLLVTGLVFPASSVMLLAGLPESIAVCHFQWFLAILCCLVTVLSTAAIAVENYARLVCTPTCYEHLTANKITATLISIWIVGVLAVTAHFTLDLGPDFCISRHLMTFHGIAAAVLVIFPSCIALFYYFKTTHCVRRAFSRPSFKPPIAFCWDYSLMKTNFYSFVTFVIFWCPFSIVLGVSTVREVSVNVSCHLAFFALTKSCVNNFLYCFSDRHFRNAYVKLFHYCCCKMTVSFSRRPRGESSRPSGDVRVHIIPGYNMYSYTSPQKGRDNKPATLKRATSAARPSGRSNGRDVYEL